MREQIQIGSIFYKRSLLYKLIGRPPAVEVYLPEKSPYFHYQITEGKNKGAYTTIPITQMTDSFVNTIADERLNLIRAGHSVI